jgi:gluconate kinase
MGLVVILGGPRGVGKTYVAELLEETSGVSYVDGDSSILGWMEAGIEPDPDDGWLEPMRDEVLRRLDTNVSVSVEVTGEWESEYKLMQRLEDAGHRLLRLWLTAPEEEVIERLMNRTRERRLPATELEGRGVYRRGAARAARERWDITLDISGPPNPALLLAEMGKLLDMQ